MTAMVDLTINCGLIIQRLSNVVLTSRGKISHTFIPIYDCWVRIECAKQKRDPVPQKYLSGCVYYGFWECGIREIFLFPGRSKMDAWSREYKTCILIINSGNHLYWYNDGDNFSLRNAQCLRFRTTFLQERRCCV
jgi:hypothetical protein